VDGQRGGASARKGGRRDKGGGGIGGRGERPNRERKKEVPPPPYACLLIYNVCWVTKKRGGKGSHEGEGGGDAAPSSFSIRIHPREWEKGEKGDEGDACPRV